MSYECRCSFYEIFNEKVFDLVDESNRDNPMGLSVREDTRKGVYVEGLMEEEVRVQHVPVVFSSRKDDGTTASNCRRVPDFNKSTNLAFCRLLFVPTAGG